MTTSDDWAKALTNFVDEIGGDGPYLWQWSGTTPTPEKVVGYLRDHVNYLEQRAKVQGAIDAGADTTPASRPLRREQIDALLEELRDPALARQFLMDAGLIDTAWAPWCCFMTPLFSWRRPAGVPVHVPAETFPAQCF
jgi:hypothetical protein